MPLHPGTFLAGRYLLTELIGEGGSARVFAAQDQLLGRDVAVKVLHDELLRLDRERFVREMRVLARLSHPGIIAIYDLGQDQGHDFFTMPLLRGGPLSMLGPLEDTSQSTERFLDAASFIALALHELHLRGLIHRDLTPGNLLLGEDGLPRIMDFGLVSMSEHTRHLTRSGITLGTPQYMSPEQARGSGLGPQSDLYALGAVLYRVACGSPPFVGDNDQSVLFQHVYEPLRDPRELNPALPAPVAQVLRHLLCKDPHERPRDGQTLYQELQVTRQHCREAASAQYRGGLTRSGLHAGGPAWPAQLEPRWTAQVGGSVTWPYAVVGNQNLLAVGTRSGTLALLSRGGQVQATLEAKDEVTAPPALLADSVIFGAWDGTLRRTSLQGQSKGQALWTHQTRAELTGTPTLWQRLVLTPSRDGHLHANHLDTGELVWAYRASGPIAASALVWAATALLIDENGWLYGLDAASGAELWKVHIGVAHATPALTQTTQAQTAQAQTAQTQATLILPTWKGEVHALNLHLRGGHAHPSAESVAWSYDLEDELWAAPAATAQQTVLASWSGQVWCLDTRSGDERWSHHTRGRLTASPVISDGAVYLASEAGELQALDLGSGRLLWQRTEAQGVQATPLLSQGELIVAFMDGTVRSYR